jgi:hypothetical protein
MVCFLFLHGLCSAGWFSLSFLAPMLGSGSLAHSDGREKRRTVSRVGIWWGKFGEKGEGGGGGGGEKAKIFFFW